MTAMRALSFANGIFRRIVTLLSRQEYDVLWIEKEVLPWVPLAAEQLLTLRRRPYVVDYDDAVFHRYDRHGSRAVRVVLGRKIDHLMANAAAVSVGNEYLAARARAAGAKRIEIIRSSIDPERYPVACARSNGPMRVCWIGSPATQKYLADVLLGGDLHTIPGIEWRVIGGSPSLGGHPSIEVVPWSMANEGALISDCDLGVMPLPDEEWERGKCGFKLVQYMACGLPVVASPVGINEEIVQDRVNGILASGIEQWRNALVEMRDNPEWRVRLGRAARQRILDEFTLDRAAGSTLQLLNEVVSEGRSNLHA